MHGPQALVSHLVLRFSGFCCSHRGLLKMDREWGKFMLLELISSFVTRIGILPRPVMGHEVHNTLPALIPLLVGNNLKLLITPQATLYISQATHPTSRRPSCSPTSKASSPSTPPISASPPASGTNGAETHLKTASSAYGALPGIAGLLRWAAPAYMHPQIRSTQGHG